MQSHFVQCLEEDWYQQRLASLLAEGRRGSSVPTLEATELLCLDEDLGHL